MNLFILKIYKIPLSFLLLNPIFSFDDSYRNSDFRNFKIKKE